MRVAAASGKRRLWACISSATHFGGKIMKLARALQFALVLLSSGNVVAQMLEFEDMLLGDRINVGDTRTTGGVTLTGRTFYWSSGMPTDDGFADVGDSGIAGGTGQELGYVNNINVEFDFGAPIVSLMLNYGDQGGNENLSINGDLQNVNSLTELDGATVGGVDVAVAQVGSQGMLMLEGTINSFQIGGQEFGIDNVMYTVPEPATGLVLLGALAVWRKRR
jgi:hypothetical protein